MLRPVRTARVTSKEELDAALATADQITVEGDDELLSYAVNKAAGDPENRVSVEIGESRSIKIVNSADLSGARFGNIVGQADDLPVFPVDRKADGAARQAEERRVATKWVNPVQHLNFLRVRSPRTVWRACELRRAVRC